MSSAHLAVENISHTYRSGHQKALSGINLEVEPGETVALVGRSGCGKSTLLHIMSGLIRPTAGEVWIDGRPITQPSPKWVMMFQRPSLYPWMTVAQNVALGLKFSGRSAEIATRVPDLLKLVELSEYADRNVQDLSGGQQQRVALARSLAPQPEILFLDEPFSALDAFTRGSLQRDVRRIAKDLDITVVLVTHDLPEAIIMAERAVVLRANPGEVSEIVPIDLANRDDLRTPEYASARARLTKAYEKAAGRDLHETDTPTVSAGNAAQSVRPTVDRAVSR
ncbi:MAG: ABC transporter ATP-binding protein [Hyphomicrobiaceae bacterium]